MTCLVFSRRACCGLSLLSLASAAGPLGFAFQLAFDRCGFRRRLVASGGNLQPIRGSSVSSIFVALALSIGLPFLMLGATSPLLQVWLARLEFRGIPYGLFALSNLASLLALASYPTLIEPHFTLRAQRLLWCAGFGAFALISAILAWRTRLATDAPPPPETFEQVSFPPRH